MGTNVGNEESNLREFMLNKFYQINFMLNKNYDVAREN